MSRSSRNTQGADAGIGRRIVRGALAVGLVAAAVVVAPFGGGGRTIEAADPAFGAGGEYHALTPDRILDTREPAPLDVEPFGRKRFSTNAAESTFDVPVVGLAGLPAFTDADSNGYDDNVLAVAVNITIVQPSTLGYLAAYGAGETPGDNSLLNFRANDINANTAILRPGLGGKLTIRMFHPEIAGDADVLIDVFGWFSSSGYTARGARLEPAGPGRILDTRLPSGGNAPLAGGATRQIQMRGITDIDTGAVVVPNDPNVVGVMVNLTGVNVAAGASPTFLAMMPAAPSGDVKTSNLNLKTNQIRSNTAIVPLSTDGFVWLYNAHGNSHVVVDVVGYFVKREDDTRRGRVVPLIAPFRAFDTRKPEHGETPLPPAYAEDWNFTDFANDVKVGGTPIGAQLGVLGNLTVAELERQFSWNPVASYIAAYPTPADPAAKPPKISNIGVVEPETVVPNMALLRYGTGQQVRFYNLNGYMHYLFDATAVILAD